MNQMSVKQIASIEFLWQFVLCLNVFFFFTLKGEYKFESDLILNLSFHEYPVYSMKRKENRKRRNERAN